MQNPSSLLSLFPNPPIISRNRFKAKMKNDERGEADVIVEPFIAPVPEQPKEDTLIRVAKAIGIILMGVTFIAIIGVLSFVVTRCDHSVKIPAPEFIHAENVVSKAAHQLILRNDADVAFGVAANPVTVGSSGTALVTFVKPTGTVGNLGEATDSSTALVETVTTLLGISVPISTQTALSTIYSYWTSDVTDFITLTTTSTTTVTRPVSKQTEENDVCVASTATMTVSVYVTLSPLPDETTVTGDASTVTTDLSLTHGLPDVTLSGNPSTQTEVQTQVSLTTGLPDATVSGDGETKTAVQTDVSLTAGLPDATVTGNPSTVSDVIFSTVSQSVVSIFTTVVITDFWGSFNPSETPTTTATATSEATLTLTVTVSGLEQKDTTIASASSSILADLTSASSYFGDTKTVTVTWTGDVPSATSLYTTIRVPPATNATTGGGTAWTSVAGEPVVVSDGGKKPEPKGWGGNLASTVMLIAIIMLVL